MKKIGIIGGGLFGCHLALKLAKSGFEVSLFEKKSEILQGTSHNNSRRVHLGYHYPRHMATARQSLDGSAKFLKEYGDFVIKHFDNYYGLAKNSRTGREHYENFLQELGAPFEKCPHQPSPIWGLKLENMQRIYKVKEYVLDIESLSRHLNQLLKQFGVEMFLNTEVESVIGKKNKWEVITEESSKSFDFLILATHSQEVFPIQHENIPIIYQEIREFHLTQILLAQIELSTPFGLTVVDGDFITVLPINNRGHYSIYSPSLSRLRVKEARKNPFTDEDIRDAIKFENVEPLIRRFYDWFEDYINIQPLKSWYAIRSVPANKTETDERESTIQTITPNLYKIQSTKLDHCMEIAESLILKIQH